MHNSLPFDGLWEDMNEASDFCGGACNESQKVDPSVQSNLKYLPTGRDLETASMPVDAMQANGYMQLDTHSFYGT
jgi:alpha-glucosidase (family GH31 glycosyl hydrolase)